MRVALIIHNSWPLMGGLEKVCLRLGQGLISRGEGVKILARSTLKRAPLERYFNSLEAKRDFDNEGVPTSVLGLGMPSWLGFLIFKGIWKRSTFTTARWVYSFFIVPQLKAQCRNCDVIHFFGNGAELLGFSAGKVARSLGIPFLVEPAIHVGQWGDSWIDLSLYRMADRVLAHTETEKEYLLSQGLTTDQVSTIVHGVDQETSGDGCLLYTSPSPRDQRGSRMPSSA